MNLSSRRPLFRRKSQTNVYRIFFWAIMVLWGVWFLRGIEVGAIQQAGLPTPTATRAAASLAQEGDVYFSLGKLDDSIEAYREAARIDPQNADTWAKLARIQTYSSALMIDAERASRLQEALISINRAKEAAPDDSTVAAIRGFVLTWNAELYYFSDRERHDRLLTEAEQEATRAMAIDSQNTLALIYYVEILTKQYRLDQANQFMRQAIERDETLMDLHRVYAYLLETQGLYNRAIEEYDKAIQINPNLTFLTLRAGAIYRHLGFSSTIRSQQTMLFEKSLEYFASAAQTNEKNEIEDPTPYLSISRTYSQMGEYFAASRNVLRALSFDPSKADIYGQLGIVFFKSRNYEGAIPALKCATRGCTPAESCEARGGGCPAGDPGTQVVGLPISSNTLVYYYTYGSVLAALSRPQESYCPEAVEIFNEIRSSPFGNDPTVLAIIQDGESICRRLANATPVTSATATPVTTPEP
jgi:tetratricopeptide (TPR) repeat protein